MSLSLNDLDAAQKSSEAFEFEYQNADGDPTGIFLLVVGSQAEKVTMAVAKLVNERRRKEAAREVQRRIQPNSKTVQFETLESDVEFGQRLAAVRLVGWRGPGQVDGLSPEQVERFQGITDPWTEDNALRLCRTNRDIAAQVTLQSDAMGNFTTI